MTRSTVKRLTQTLDEPEREFRRLKRDAWCLQQTESLAIAGRNLFDAEASSSNNTGAKPPTPPKTLDEHSHPNPSGFQNPITLPTEQTGRIVDSRDIWITEGNSINSLNSASTLSPKKWGGIELKNMGHLKRACSQIPHLETPTQEVGLKNHYLIFDYCRGSHEADECKQTNLAEHVCLSGGDIYNDPSLLRFY
ncbi:hypothetical protein Tco_0479443 [Tanacetum coccineum]